MARLHRPPVVANRPHASPGIRPPSPSGMLPRLGPGNQQLLERLRSRGASESQEVTQEDPTSLSTQETASPEVTSPEVVSPEVTSPEVTSSVESAEVSASTDQTIVQTASTMQDRGGESQSAASDSGAAETSAALVSDLDSGLDMEPSAPTTSEVGQIASASTEVAPSPSTGDTTIAQATPATTDTAQAVTLDAVRSGTVAKSGSRGPAIAQMQRALSRLGFGVQATGELGPTTQAVLRRFQEAYGVQATGELGPTTLSMLDRALQSSITLAELRAIGPNISDANARAWLPYLNASMVKAGLTTKARQAAYLAQLAHETDGFNTLEEYADGSSYEGRWDLGNSRAGDGRRFKGRGAIQLTGRANYTSASQRLGVDLVNNPGLAADPRYAFAVSADYWTQNGVNGPADRGDFEGTTDIINYYDPESRRRSRRAYHRTARGLLDQSARPTGVSAMSGEYTARTGTVAQSDGKAADAGSPVAAGKEPSAEVEALLTQADAAVASGKGEEAKEKAHAAANQARALRTSGALDAGTAQALIDRGGRIWTAGQALLSQSGGRRSSRGALGVWTTGRSGGSGVTSRLLPRDWDMNDTLAHHSDRSRSWAANNIRNATNQDLQAYDFTFEKLDSRGAPVAGSAKGVELIVPSDSKVIDIQTTYQGSGGYGRFIALEDVETGARLSIHHLDTVGDFRVGQVLRGGTIFGTHGGSGNSRSSYATHVDVVGTRGSVERFVRSNQEGTFRTRSG